MDLIIFIAYCAIGYWAVGKTIYANKILIGTSQAIFFKKFFFALGLGWILIPIAVIKSIINR